MTFWMPVPGFEGFYEANAELGQVRSVARKALCRGGKYRSVSPKVLAGTPDKDGYLLITLYAGSKASKKMTKIHWVIMETFVGPRPPELEVRHLNDIKSDNRLENLVYGTGVENWEDWRNNTGLTHRNWNR